MEKNRQYSIGNIIKDSAPEDGPFINIEGKEGKSLFYRPLVGALQGEGFGVLQKRFKEYGLILNKAKDHRLLALVGHMVIEEALDLFLGAEIKGYDQLLKDKAYALTMSFKIDLAKSMHLIPAHIFKGAEVINTIRNKFAHTIKYEHFDDLDKRLKGRMRETFSTFVNAVGDEKDLSDLYAELVAIIILATGIYTEHVKIMKDYMKTDKYKKGFNEYLKNKT